MNDLQQRTAAKAFAAAWAGRGDEKSDTQTFWLSLLRDVYGLADPAADVEFEKRVMLDHTSFIDVYIRPTQVMVEQKSIYKDLSKPIRQSDGTLLKPIQQLQRYAGALGKSQFPRWAVTCNFEEFRIYDMEHPNADPEILKLADLEREYPRLQFLVDTEDANIKKEMEISLQAGELVGALYDAILKQYDDPQSPETLKSLNKLCVRLVFCLYAEDAGIFGRKNRFHDYLQQQPTRTMHKALKNLFHILDTKPEDRDRYEEKELLAFPYVNGGLFADEKIEIPYFTEEIRNLLLSNASDEFDWSGISPTIFGAVFESTLNPETRRAGGMHYTSIQNIHKVIDPLFLDALKAELAAIEAVTVDRTRNTRLEQLQQKLASLVFFEETVA